MWDPSVALVLNRVTLPRLLTTSITPPTHHRALWMPAPPLLKFWISSKCSSLNTPYSKIARPPSLLVCFFPVSYSLSFSSTPPPQLLSIPFPIDGPWDIRDFITKQCIHSDIQRPAYFSEPYVNVRLLFSDHYKEIVKRNIELMLRKLGLEFEGRQHSGLDDARNVARIVRRLAEDGAVIKTNQKWREGGGEKKTKTRQKKGKGKRKGEGGEMEGGLQ